MNFAEALGVLLEAEEQSKGEAYYHPEMRRKCWRPDSSVAFSWTNVDTNETVPHLMTQGGKFNETYFWTPTPLDVCAQDWEIVSR